MTTEQQIESKQTRAKTEKRHQEKQKGPRRARTTRETGMTGRKSAVPSWLYNISK
jgi:hypothetical protein